MSEEFIVIILMLLCLVSAIVIYKLGIWMLKKEHGGR